MEQTIGPYRVVQAVGKGGMGTVVRVRHAQTGAIAAVKTVPPTNVAHVGFIRREIHALAQLRHPGIVRILDHGVDAGVPWYAMEYVDGPTLREFRENLFERMSPGAGRFAAPSTATAHDTVAADGEGATTPTALGELHPVRLPEADPATRERIEPILTTICRLCDALAYLHGEGLVHRDLKPDNIIVRPDGAPILVDFGVISRFPGDAGREVLQLDHPTAGTIPYMAPELIAGLRVDARADLYALGCMLYQLVTGRSPFEGFNYGAIARQHLSATPVPPSALAPGLPLALNLLILRLLAKRPQDRLGYATDVAQALAEAGARRMVSASAPVPRTYLYLPRFVGRDDELSTLRQIWRETEKGGIALVRGESGIGKTRLLLEFGREVKRDNAIVLEGQGTAPTGQAEQGRAPLAPLHGALRWIADRCRTSGIDPFLAPRLKLLAAYDASLASLPEIDGVAAPAELPPAAAQARLYRFLAEALSWFAAESRVCLLIDDLQWVDELTQGFLQSLVSEGQLDRLPIIVVAAYRSDEAPTAVDEMRGARGVHQLELHRVGEDAVGAIVDDMIGHGATPAAFVEFLSAQSGGNPFFIAEYIRTAVAEGVLFRDAGGRWQLAGARGSGSAADYADLPLPGSLQDLVRRRLSTLSPAGLALTEAASVLGRSFSIELLGDVVGLDEDGLWSALEEIGARHVVEDVAEGEMRFVHDQLRSAAYAAIDDARRRSLHHAAALAYERRGADDGEVAGTLGLHWAEAGERARARRYYLVAGRHATARHAQVQAAAAYRAYLGLVDVSDVDSVTARIELGRDVLIVRADLAEALAELERARDEARALGDRVLEGNAVTGLSKLYWRMGDLHNSNEQALQAIAMFGPSNPEGVAMGKERLAAVAFKQGRIDDALALCSDVLATRRPLGNTEALAMALGNMGAILLVAKRPDDAVEVLSQALEIRRRSGETASLGFGGVLNNLAVAATMRGEIDKALPLLEQAREVLTAVGDRFASSSPLVELAILSRRALGDMAAGARYIGEVMSGELVADPVSCIQCHVERGHHSLAAGGSAEPHLSRAREIVAQLGAVPGSEAADALHRLERAQGALDAGLQLFRGECASEVPAGIKRWLQGRGEWPDWAE